MYQDIEVISVEVGWRGWNYCHGIIMDIFQNWYITQCGKCLQNNTTKMTFEEFNCFMVVHCIGFDSAKSWLVYQPGLRTVIVIPVLYCML